MSPLPLLKGRQVINALVRMGYKLVRSRGSHFRFEHSELKRSVSVAVHAGRAVARTTLRSILSQAKVSIEELMRHVKIF